MKSNTVNHVIYESSVKPDFNYLIKQNGPCLGFIISSEIKKKKKCFFFQDAEKKNRFKVLQASFLAVREIADSPSS